LTLTVYTEVTMDQEYVSMRRRMSRLRVKCGKGASLEGRVLDVFATTDDVRMSLNVVR